MTSFLGTTIKRGQDMTDREGRFIGTLLVAVALAGGPGCICFNKSKPIPISPECSAACADLPCCCRGEVYVFLISGFDPFDLDHVAEFRTSLIRAGFIKIYNGQCYHDIYFSSEMCRIAREDPEAKFVLVGFSLGADYAVSLAESVANHGIPITLLASIDPYWWSSAPSKMPPNVQQAMYVHGEPLLFANRASAGMEVQIPETFPANITGHPLTVESLALAIANIAGSLPRPAPQSPASELANDQPTPRPISRKDDPRDAWDFLKPVATLRALTPVDSVGGGERTSLRPVQPAAPN